MMESKLRLPWKLSYEAFLEKINLPRLNQEEIEVMNNPIASTEIEAVIKNLPNNKTESIPPKVRKQDKGVHFPPYYLT